MHLNYADFGRLSLSSPFSPKVARQFHMQGMSYKYIRAVPQPELSPPWYKIPLLLYQEPPVQFSVVRQRGTPPASHRIPPLLLYQEPPAYFNVVRQRGPSPESHNMPPLLPLHPEAPAYLPLPSPLYLEPTAIPDISVVSQAESESESREALLQLANQSAYSANVYSSLEEFFFTPGRPGRCRQCFLCRKTAGARRILSQP